MSFSTVSCSFKLWDVSIGISMEVFCLLAFLVCVVTLGAGDAGSSGLVDFWGLRALGVGALGSSSGFLVGILFFLFSGNLRPSVLGTRGGVFGAGFDTSISASFSGVSFVVSVVWMLFWEQAFARWLVFPG